MAAILTTSSIQRNITVIAAGEFALRAILVESGFTSATCPK